MSDFRLLPSGDVFSMDGLRAIFFHGTDRVDLVYDEGADLKIDSPADVAAIRRAVQREPEMESLR